MTKDNEERFAALTQTLDDVARDDWPALAASESVAWHAWESLQYLAGKREDQEGYRYAVALRVLRKADKSDEHDESKAAAALGKELGEVLQSIVAAVEQSAPPLDEESGRLADATENAERARLLLAGAELQTLLDGRQMPDLYATDARGMFRLDAAALRELERLGEKASGSVNPYREGALARATKWREVLDAHQIALAGRVADEQREASARLIATREEATEALARWLLPAKKDHTPAPDAVLMLADCLWSDRVLPRLNAHTFAPSIVATGGDHYAKISKIVAPISWAMGAPGQPVTVDGDEYANEPSLTTKLLPRTYALLPADHASRPHQTALALEPDEADALPVAIANAQGIVMSTGAALLALQFFADEKIRRGQTVRLELGELTKRLRPDSKRVQQRDHEKTAEFLEELSNLSVFLPDDTKVHLFDMQTPRSPEAARSDMPLLCALSRTCAAALGNIQGPGLKGNEYSGEFLINLSGTMRLGMSKPTLLRHYIRAAAHWNAAFEPGTGAFDPSRMKAHDIDHWAAIANAFPPGVVEYLAAKGEDRKRLADRRRARSKERQRVKDDWDELAARGLVVVDKAGDRYRLLPTEQHQEARRTMRQRGGRPDGDS